MVDAILKEKCISFMPNYVSLVAMMKGLLSMNTARSLREYLGIDYTPNYGIVLLRRRSPPFSDEYFGSPHVVLWFPIPVLLSVVFVLFCVHPASQENLPFLLVSTSPVANQTSCLLMSFVILIFSLNLTQGLYTLLLCDQLRFSFACATKWFLQTICVGYPSLRILTEHGRKVQEYWSS
ncbi:hypothetical protein V3C99_018022 [Haemonchus contortus]